MRPETPRLTSPRDPALIIFINIALIYEDISVRQARQGAETPATKLQSVPVTSSQLGEELKTNFVNILELI